MARCRQQMADQNKILLGKDDRILAKSIPLQPKSIPPREIFIVVASNGCVSIAASNLELEFGSPVQQQRLHRVHSAALPPLVFVHRLASSTLDEMESTRIRFHSTHS